MDNLAQVGGSWDCRTLMIGATRLATDRTFPRFQNSENVEVHPAMHSQMFGDRVQSIAVSVVEKSFRSGSVRHDLPQLLRLISGLVRIVSFIAQFYQTVGQPGGNEWFTPVFEKNVGNTRQARWSPMPCCRRFKRRGRGGAKIYDGCRNALHSFDKEVRAVKGEEHERDFPERIAEL